MKNKRMLLLFVILAIAVVGVVIYFISRPQHQELIPPKFAQLPEKPKLIAEFHHDATLDSGVDYPEGFSQDLALPIYSVAFSPVDTSLIASVNGAGTIMLWNINNTKEPIKILSHPRVFPFIGFSPKGKLLACAGYGKLVLWDVASGTKLNILETSNRQFAFTPDGHQLATVRNGIKLWDIRNPKKIGKIATLPFNEAYKATGWACAVGISADGKWIAAGYSNGTVNVWDLQTQQLVKTLETSFYEMDFLKFSPNNKYMVSGGHEWDMYITSSVKGYIMWKLPSWQRKGEVLRGNVENLVFSPNGKICITANHRFSSGRGVELWSADSGTPITSLFTKTRDVSFSNDGRLLATGNDYGKIHVWELTSQQLELATTPSDTVRIVYSLPKDKKPSPNITQKLDKAIREVQDFYADEMERHGFGRKTFTFETDKNGKAKIYLIKENQIRNYDLLNDIWLVYVDDKSKLLRSVPLINDYYNYNRTFWYPTKKIIWKEEVKGFIGRRTIVSVSKKGFDWRLIAYELKHQFAALDGKYRVNESNALKRFFFRVNNMMPWGKGWAKLSRCEAELLDKSRFFNPNQPFFDKSPKMDMRVAIPKASGLRHFIFEVADEDGMHQVQLFVLRNVKNLLSVEVKFYECQALDGKTKASVVFEISDPEIMNVVLRMIDMHGNIASREFQIEDKESEPSEKP